MPSNTRSDENDSSGTPAFAQALASVAAPWTLVRRQLSASHSASSTRTKPAAFTTAHARLDSSNSLTADLFVMSNSRRVTPTHARPRASQHWTKAWPSVPFAPTTSTGRASGLMPLPLPSTGAYESRGVHRHQPGESRTGCSKVPRVPSAFTIFDSAVG